MLMKNLKVRAGYMLKSMSSWKWFVLIVVGVVVDQWTKFSVLQHFQLAESLNIMPSLNFTLSYNAGIAFGWFSSGGQMAQYALLGITAMMTIGLSIWLVKTPKAWPLQALALSFIVSGATGNLIDRMFRGYVVDFIDFYVKQWHFHTFNVADALISVGAGLLILSSFIYKDEAEVV